MTSQYRRSLQTQQTVYYNQQLIKHAHGLRKMACMVMKRKLKKSSYISELKLLTEIQYPASLLMVKLLKSVILNALFCTYL